MNGSRNTRKKHNMDEIEYATAVVGTAKSAEDATETMEQAADLLSDALALVLAETGLPNMQAFERITEARKTFGGEGGAVKTFRTQ